MIGNFITIRDIVGRIKRNPLMEDLAFEAAVDYTVECLSRVGVIQYQDGKLGKVTVIDKRGLLPDDMIAIETIRVMDGDNFKPLNKNSLGYGSTHKAVDDYDIKGKYIFTSMEEGELEVRYRGLFLDESGYPLIPDNQDLIRAVMEWIKKEHFEILVAMGVVSSGVLQRAEREYAWYVGRLQSTHLLRTLDERQEISKILTNIFDDPRDFDRIIKGVSYD